MQIFNMAEVIPQIPNILFRGRFRFIFEKMPFEAKSITWKKKLNFFIAGLNQIFLPSIPFGYPVIAQVEPANICNLSCTLCLTASINHERKPGLLSLETFKKFIDEYGEYILIMIFWNWGEPFLNPDAIEMISYATSKGILIHTSTNGNIPFTQETAERIVDSKLTSMIIAMDGATQEVYSTYRQGGDLEMVKANIRLIQEVKKAKGSEFPRITVRFVAMHQNEEEMQSVKSLARELGADFFAVKSVDMPPDRGTNLDEKYRPEAEQLRRYQYREGSFQRKKLKFQCMRPWKRITLDALGEVIACEYEYKDLHSFGNINGEKSVNEVWKSQESQVFRKNFHLGHNEYYLCKNCTYKNMVGDDCIISAEQLT